MPAGRPTKPKLLKEMAGNPGRRPLADDAPVSIGSPVQPDYLDDYAREVWNRITDSMPSRLYGAVDTQLLAAYCRAASLHRQATFEMRISGEVVTGEGGAPYQSPWMSILNRQAALLVSIGARLGLDPAARSNLSVKPDAPVSKFAGLVGIKGGRSA